MLQYYIDYNVTTNNATCIFNVVSRPGNYCGEVETKGNNII